MSNYICERNFSSAEEFLENLNPRGSLFGHYYHPGGWLYRGQMNDKPLTPSALRPTASFMRPVDEDYHGEWVTGVQTSLREQIRCEVDNLIWFVGIADSMGLPIPEDSQR